MFRELLGKVNRFINENRLSGIIIAAFAFILVLLFSLTEIYDVFEHKLYDLRFKLKPNIAEWQRLTFVDIDELSLTTVGKFPWPRDIYAKGFRALKAIGVSQVALDIMFPDRSPVHLDEKAYRSILKKARREKPLKPEEIRSVAVNSDMIFARGMADIGNVLLSYTFNYDVLSSEKIKVQQGEAFKRARERFIQMASIPIPKGKEEDFRRLADKDARGIVYPIPELMEAARSFGFVHRETDVDGVIRKIRLIRAYEGRIYFNLALAMYIEICQASLENIEIIPGKRITLKKAFNPSNHKIEDISIPIDDDGMIYINWAGPGPREKSFHIVPFYSLLDYNDYAPIVHDFFDAEEAKRGKFERSKLYGMLEKAVGNYSRAKDHTERLKIWNEILGLRKSITEIKRSYYNDLKAEAERMKKELQKKKDKQLAGDYEILKDDLRAIDLVIRVEKLTDHLILTGLTATGTHDIGVIPKSKEYARVGTYHNAVNTIFFNEYIRKSGPFLNYIVMLFAALVIGFSIQRMDAKISIITISASFFIANVIVFSLFSFMNLWIDQLGINLSILIPSVSITAVKFLNEESQKRFIKNAFSRYLTPGVIDEIIKNPESLELGGEDREITIFFSDIKGFSTISEKLTAPELVVRLNEYLSEMTDIILSHGGTVDKYEGDAIMAFYGAPYFMDDHAKRACFAAIDMNSRLMELKDKWIKEGKDVLYTRMGMNTGIAVVGNMGSSARMDYTAMGDSVNLASRLEGVNKVYSTFMMISETTYEIVKDDVDARMLDKIRVVGKMEPVIIYELMGRKESLEDKTYEMVGLYNEGIKCFNNHEWKKGRTFFKNALKVDPDDGPSQIYVKRCTEFMKKAPSRKWDGVYVMKSK